MIPLTSSYRKYNTLKAECKLSGYQGMDTQGMEVKCRACVQRSTREICGVIKLTVLLWW